ncbi:conjugal transfer protein TraS [Klebsiella pneumoniae]|nr:conjugal transfer protein TraS [Klebsiella pneumoniae]RRF57734.1 conjugal transfer protein TraS [Klebsiella pneumoniae]
MMMTNKILIEEVDELKNVFSRGEMEIPSFWSCLWRSNCCRTNMICALISVGGGYLSVKFIFWVLVFPGVISLIVLLGVASARSLFLSVPRTYRMRSQVYRFISRKVMVYALVYMALILALALFNRVYYASPFPFSFMILIATIFVWFVMNIDFGRYQLSVLSSAINSFRAEKLGGMIQRQPINYGGLLTA